MSKQKREQAVSPLGTVKYSHLTKPNTKFKAQGEYSVDLVLDPSDAKVKAFLDDLHFRADSYFKTFVSEAKDGKQKKARESYKLHVPFVNETDDEGDETGLVILKVKNSAEVTKKNGETFKKTINHFDAKRKQLTGVKVGRGTQLKAAFTLNPFGVDGLKTAGLGLWLEAVQIIKLVEYGGNDAQSLGFGEEEGYEGTEESEQSEVSAESGEPVAAGQNEDFA